MFFLLIALFAGTNAHCLFNLENYTYEEKYIEVPLDHFSFSNNDTFLLRYLYNNSYWKSGGPVFFYTGNEGTIESFAENTGFLWETARDFEALIVFAEHRYYGKSLPFGNQSLTPEKVGHLTSSQALADYVLLISYLQSSLGFKENPLPVVAFGGSYGGMLAAWLRMKYPSGVIGAIASSAPILQFANFTPCNSFSSVVTSVFRTSTGGDCTILIKRSWEEIRTILATEEGKSWLSQTWNLCKPIKTDDDIDLLMSWMEEIYGNLAMINYPYPTNFLAPVPGHPVSAVCERLLDTSLTGKALAVAIIEALSIYTNYTGQARCTSIDSSTEGIDEKAWEFQSCTELVMPSCSLESDMFEEEEWNFDDFENECFERWGVRAHRQDGAVLEYGGRHLKPYSNIVFSNGMLDPWAPGGVLKNISRTVIAILMADAAHHLDLRATNCKDPLSVREARQVHRDNIRAWLKEHYDRSQSLL